MRKLIAKIFNHPAHPITVGIVGLASTQTTFAMNSEQVQSLSQAATTTGDPVTLIIQIVIGIATLIKLFRKNNESTSN